ncbi:MAG: MarR family transcriptional regulator [Lachnospiraceae bacterium]|nr:MarR family transcriptional regulator [Lachnospiraceae bacterium]
MGLSGKEEEFFLKYLYVDHVFQIIERVDYYLIYNIEKCSEQSDIPDGAYLSDLPERMKLPIERISEAMRGMEEKGYVTWELHDSKERTYVKLTNRALEQADRQRQKIVDAYNEITENIPRHELEITVATLGKIRELMADEA